MFIEIKRMIPVAMLDDRPEIGFEKGDCMEHEVPMFTISADGYIDRNRDYEGKEDPLELLEKFVSGIKQRRAKAARDEQKDEDRKSVLAAGMAGDPGEMKNILVNSEYDPEEDMRFWANMENQRWFSSWFRTEGGEGVPLPRESWQALIDKGFDIETVDWDGYTPLLNSIEAYTDCYAWNHDDLDIVPKKRICFERIEMFLSLGANVEARKMHPNGEDFLSMTPMFEAVEEGDQKLVDLLLLFGASKEMPTSPTNIGCTKSPEVMKAEWVRMVANWERAV